MVNFHIDYKWYKDVPPYVSGGANLVISAHDSIYPGKADYQCSGVDDQMLINFVLGLLPDGGTVALTDGEFVLSNSIVLPVSGIHLIGMSRDTLINGNALPTGSPAIVISDVQNCSVQNMSIRTLGGGGNVCHCILIEDGADGTLLKQVSILDSDSDAIHIEGTNITGLWILDCVVAEADGSGILTDMDGGNFIRRLYIEGCSISSCAVDGIQIESGQTYVEIRGNSISDITQYGINALSQGFFFIVGNSISSCGNGGIRVLAYNSVVHGNLVTTCNTAGGDYAIWIQAPRCIASNNMIHNTNASGILIFGDECLVSGNLLPSIAGYGIYLMFHALVVGNTIMQSGYHGVVLSVGAFNSHVIGNYIYRAGQSAAATYHGIYVAPSAMGFNCSRASIIGNYVIDTLGNATEDGIHINGDADSSVIRDNYIYNLMGSGIYLSGGAVFGSDDCVIEGNYVEACDDYGIEIVAGAAGCARTRCIGNKLVGNVTGQISDGGTNTQLPEIYVPVANPNSNIGNHPSLVLTDGADITDRMSLRIPKAFQELVRAYAIVVPGGSGNMRRSVATNWGVLGLAEHYNTHSDSIAAGEIAVTQDHLESIDILAALTGIAANDLVGVAFTREGSHINDTVGANCYLLGLTFQYV